MNSIIENAAKLAVVGHRDQTRKDDDSPYVVHPFMIALMLGKEGFPDEVIAAALCHDLLEDSDIDPEALREAIGGQAFALVEAVTYDDSLSWEERRKKYAETVASAPEGAKAISIADKIHNAESLIAAHARSGPALWSHFTKPKEQKLWFEDLMLDTFKRTWNHPLIARYEALVQKMHALD